MSCIRVELPQDPGRHAGGDGVIEDIATLKPGRLSWLYNRLRNDRLSSPPPPERVVVPVFVLKLLHGSPSREDVSEINGSERWRFSRDRLHRSGNRNLKRKRGMGLSLADVSGSEKLTALKTRLVLALSQNRPYRR